VNSEKFGEIVTFPLVPEPSRPADVAISVIVPVVVV